jgi:hypothetical protein
VLEQQKPDHQLRVLRRTSDIGKRLPVLILKILPGDELGDPKLSSGVIIYERIGV